MWTGQAVKQSADCLTMKMEELLSFETSVATSEHGVTPLYHHCRSVSLSRYN